MTSTAFCIGWSSCSEQRPAQGPEKGARMTNKDRVENSIKCTNGFCEDIINQLNTNELQLTNAYLSILAVHVKEISRSLAAIADALEKGES